MRCVNDTLPPRARARWLLITIRLSNSSLTGTDRTLVAVGTARLASMLATVRAAAPRRMTLSTSPGPALGAVGAGALAAGAGAAAGAGSAGAGGVSAGATGVAVSPGAGSGAGSGAGAAGSAGAVDSRSAGASGVTVAVLELAATALPLEDGVLPFLKNVTHVASTDDGSSL